jgi:hypothetical protein
MTRADIVDILRRLHFKRDRDRCVVELDQGVRDFLVQACKIADDTARSSHDANSTPGAT